MGTLLERYRKLAEEMKESVVEQKEVVVSYQEVSTLIRLLEQEQYHREQLLAEQNRVKEHKRLLNQQPQEKVDKTSGTKELHLINKEAEHKLNLLDLIGARLTDKYAVYREMGKVTEEVEALKNVIETQVGYEETFKEVKMEEIGGLKAEGYTGIIIDGSIQEMNLVQILRQGLKVYVVKDKMSQEKLSEYKDKLSQYGCTVLVTTSI